MISLFISSNYTIETVQPLAVATAISASVNVLIAPPSVAEPKAPLNLIVLVPPAVDRYAEVSGKLLIVSTAESWLYLEYWINVVQLSGLFFNDW